MESRGCQDSQPDAAPFRKQKVLGESSRMVVHSDFIGLLCRETLSKLISTVDFDKD